MFRASKLGLRARVRLSSRWTPEVSLAELIILASRVGLLQLLLAGQTSLWPSYANKWAGASTLCSKRRYDCP